MYMLWEQIPEQSTKTMDAARSLTTPRRAGWLDTFLLNEPCDLVSVQPAGYPIWWGRTGCAECFLDRKRLVRLRETGLVCVCHHRFGGGLPVGVNSHKYTASEGSGGVVDADIRLGHTSHPVEAAVPVHVRARVEGLQIQRLRICCNEIEYEVSFSLSKPF